MNLHKTLKMFLAIIVSLQFGIFLPLAPVLAQTADNIATNTEQVEPTADVVNTKETEVPVDLAVPIKEEAPVAGQEIITDISTSTEISAPVVNSDESEDLIVSYTGLMRDLKDVRIGKIIDKKSQVLSDFESFITAEKDRLDKLNIPREKKKDYLNRLEGQMKGIDEKQLSGLKKVWENIKTFFGLETEELIFDEEVKKADGLPEIKIPTNPAEFSFNQEVLELQSLGNIEINQGQKIDQAIKAFISIDQVKADSGSLPVIGDVQSDNGEIIINSTIKDLASNLHNNPVEIYNFVRANINYEPYYGAKKGNLGCLEEKLCNDVDSASLTISLLRAAGIPANYKKSIMVVSVAELQEMLGLDKTVEARRTVYGVFGWNKVPIFTITDNPTVGQNLDNGDFTNETHFALEWVFPELYYDYDERGGNINNLLDLSTVSTTEDLQILIQDQYKKQWIPLDVIFKDYNRTQHEIVAETANFNSENFWYGFYQYQGALSPLNKYIADLQTATGKNVSSTAYQSFNEPSNRAYEILPPTLPYALGSGVDSNGNQILPEIWSSFPDARKQQVKIQLLRSDNDEVVLDHTFFGSEINNKELNLYYEGATEDDQAIIESYGGIHATPAELVDIKPYLSSDYERYEVASNVAIGDSLKLRFEYYVNGIKKHDDEKFSTAGNQEGIYVVLSKVQVDPYLGTNSEILLRGNVGLAREYLKRIQNAGELYEKSLDYNYNSTFSRAVVTQNRILNKVNGTPTTFDFKGLTLDASTFINDWSNRGNYKNHRKDFRLLWGLEASYQEGQIFTDVAGLEGISTVKGLQYAYAHPADYTVQTITSSTENIIDTLALSTNTKANMHTDVQEGNTIITPNKFVSDGNWHGIFYVSLDPEWTGTYAIGEQTQSNGGWTVSNLLHYIYIDIDGKERTNFFVNLGDTHYHYEDNIYESGVQCRIKNVEYDIMKASQNWNNAYGEPCMVDSVSFGNVDHAYMLATNGTYFYSPNKYDYWQSKSNIVTKMNQYISALPRVDVRYNFSFSTILGTYRQSICTYKGVLSYNCDNYSYESVYYSPDSNNGHVYRLKAGFLEKAGQDDNKIIKILGFPVSDEQSVVSSFGTHGVKQNFPNGQLYYFDKYGIRVYYIDGSFWHIYNEQFGGPSGELGFPTGDPENGKNGHVIQVFENKEQLNLDPNFKALGAGHGGVVSLEEYRKYQCDLNNWLINDYSMVVLFPIIMAHGFLDSAVNLVSDGAQLVGSLFNALIHPLDTASEIKEITTELQRIGINQLLTILVNAGNQTIVDEWNESIGPNGCNSRRMYMSGRVIGDVIALLIPASKLKAATKLKVIEYAQESRYGVKAINLFAKWVEYRQGVLDKISSWIVPNKFEREGIEHVLIGKINDVTGKFQGSGFHSSNSLKNVIENNIWDVAGDQTGSKIYRKLSDLPVDKNGIRYAWIKKTEAFEYKSFFPDNWSDQDIVSAIVEASGHPTVTNEFFSVIIKNGKSVPIKGYFKSGTSMIDTGFPIFTL